MARTRRFYFDGEFASCDISNYRPHVQSPFHHSVFISTVYPGYECDQKGNLDLEPQITGILSATLLIELY